MSAKRILIMAGGTGGHVFPGLAVAKLLQHNGWQVHWLGTSQRMEAQLVPQHGFEISFIDVQGVRGNGLLRLLKAPFKLAKAVLQARKVLKDFKPDVVLGMGGFASGPGGLAARTLGVPLVLHEQNAVAGVTNKILAKFASKVMVAFESALPEVTKQVVGNPVRADILALAAQPPVAIIEQKSVAINEQKPLHLLVVGGSLGAQVLNETLPAMLPLLTGDRKVAIKHQVGKGNSAKVVKAYPVDAPVEVSDFIDDMAQSYAWADLVICRAGALTVSEIAVLGLPAIFVPLPYAVDDHQTKNAQQLTELGAAKILVQSTMTPAVLAALVDELNQPTTLNKMAQAAQSLGANDACQQVAAACATLAGASASELNNLLETTEVK